MTHDTNLFYHKPVLVQEVLEYLNLQPAKTYLDVTFGCGGHTRAILEEEPQCKVIAFDWDEAALETYAKPLLEEYPGRFFYVWGNFAHLYKLAKKMKIDSVDGILADFGASQVHLFEREGFSFLRDTPLDMRMSPAHQKTTAAHIINKGTPEELREIFWQLGEERNARVIVDTIMEHRKRKRIRSTKELAAIVEEVVPRRGGIHPATKVFQALRMYINKELNNIEAFLPVAVELLNPGGRLVCITFHSLEDRMVKTFFREETQKGGVRLLTKSAIGPTREEVRKNPASRSAKLRAIEKI